MPISKANMLLRAIFPSHVRPHIDQWLHEHRDLVAIVGEGTVTKASSSSSAADAVASAAASSSGAVPGEGPAGSKSLIHLDLRSDPEVFRKLEELIQDKAAGDGRLEVLQLRVAAGTQPAAVAPAAVSSAAGGEKAKASQEVPRNCKSALSIYISEKVYLKDITPLKHCYIT
jgi:hypothetical protein